MAVLAPPPPASLDADLALLRRAARLAWRGHGGAEPNPLVGCVIADASGRVAGEGYHRRCGGPHAEIEALRRSRGAARGGTAYVTLEPCDHHGRTGPCSAALIDAGVTRVVYARPDDSRTRPGGAERLRAAGITVDFVECPEAAAPGEPFAWRARTGRPWVIAKWAQTIDGRIAPRSGASRWISGERSRDLVHRERGRVDAILTGIGTVLADDPRLTARGVRRRRIARRIVVDPRLEIPPRSELVQSIDEAPLTIITAETTLAARAHQAEELRTRGAELLGVEQRDTSLELAGALRELTRRHEMSTVLVEAGGRLLGRLFAEQLVREAWVFIAPILFGDDQCDGAVRGLPVHSLTDATRLNLISRHWREPDVLLRYEVAAQSSRAEQMLHDGTR